MSTGPRLQGKTAIITGAASGIGAATATLFAEHGASLVLADVVEEALAAVAAKAEEKGAKVVYKTTDVSDEEQVKALVDLALETYGQIDVLCNNAGITGDFTDMNSEDQENWKKVLAVNLIGPVLLTKYAAPHMKEKGCGSIVNTASVAGIRAGAGSNAYSASKAALINFTKTAACDLGSFNVRVNAVCPGLIETGMTKMVFDYARDTGKEAKLGSRCEMKRYGLPHEIAFAILFLASDESSYVTGQHLAVDGGNTASLNLPGMKF
ncbi:NAD(P)-dependent dehydrogenase, short-chain alcohol dehydrogenase family [Desulfatibacillum alkenivorans DSM 16219]|jgi:NAD(P)-dependent dehydrogenase (short-subunit alcohol dehydrogenase family)|uniref:NAD(P)-dependent dehydrogenase, short-chain alcohol dehydrogenase family n=1 Tax=Desulfatibacillum alkenivorans DSM 16219 TaxID=1121393 RepID=A0A1M6GAB4_9BACT|nr:SDR family NAD(P)-dependent oxidoreductase [Desulfatibacillum alkenivorans]SHJ06891.1 NAD(P)-dependent dehydrogenase, short-chain alcohol dehydrogenase family [Desulfatibacillum alkenivorans DSM 16219]